MRFEYKITSGWKAWEEIRDKAHNGIDFNFPVGTELKALANGIIHIKDFGDVNAGKTVFIETEDGSQLIYGHLSEFAVKEGQRVSIGETIGYSGNTGHSTGAHLHFGLKDANGEFVDPSKYTEAIKNMHEPSFWNEFVNNGQIGGLDSEIVHPVDFFGSRFIEWLANSGIDILKDMLTYIYTNVYHVLPEIGALLTIVFGILIMITGDLPKWGFRYGISILGVILWGLNGI